ncbi:MAG TPA: MBL fold metallo-hydrolase [Candidatus Limnocylindrales bacterium]
MDLQFLGGATTVTGSQFLLETGSARILVDCGLFQGSPNEAVRNRVPLAYDPATLDAILITHAHLDHCGLLPIVVREGFRGPIYATDGTIELAELVLLDSGRLQEEFAKREAKWERRHPDLAPEDDRREREVYEEALRLSADAGPVPPEAATVAATTVSEEAAMDLEADLRSQPPAIDIDLDVALYTEREARRVLERFRAVRYDQPQDVAPGIRATYLDAGHILGSAIIRLEVSEPGTPDRIIVFSGDLGRPGTPIIRDPTTVTGADYVVVESTYGGREHEPQAEAVRILAETIRLVAEADGVLLVPSFAIGRTQEVVWELDRLVERGEIPLLPIYLDSPMASAATDIYRRHADYFDENARRVLATEGTPLDHPAQVVTNDFRDSEAIAHARRPYLIVASNGMLTGGRVLGHLRRLIDDPAATLLFVGYQGEGTLGAHLQAGAKTVRLDGQERTVRCAVRSISGFSAHADESELLAWLGAFGGDGGPRPRRVFLVHGDPEAQQALEPKVAALGFRVHVPRWRERVALD